MSESLPTPPGWARALLRSVVKPSDSESIPGDLLEEYREVRHTVLGGARADAWYLRSVMSLFWRVLWPCAVPLVVVKLLSLTGPVPWNRSLVQAPGVSLLDALAFVWAGYYGAQRTGLVRTGIVAAAATSVLGLALMAMYAVVKMPGLLLAPFEKPFIFVIMVVLLAIALGFAIMAGSVGAAVGWRLPLTRNEGVV